MQGRFPIFRFLDFFIIKDNNSMSFMTPSGSR